MAEETKTLIKEWIKWHQKAIQRLEKLLEV